MTNSFFITGISTDVGKTLASAIIVKALGADYWKPIQAGDLESSDTKNVKALVGTTDATTFHPEGLCLQTPMSPHAAAALEEIKIDIQKIVRPKTENNLVIEGAGGLLVPLNDQQTIADLILPEDKIVLVSRHYLGSINHTLLTVEALNNRNLKVAGIIFSGDQHQSTESIISIKTKIPIIGRINEEAIIDSKIVEHYASLFSQNLNNL